MLKEIRARASRLWRKHITKALIVGICVAVFTGFNDATSPETSLTEILLVPMAPGLALWAITGNFTWLGWGSRGRVHR